MAKPPIKTYKLGQLELSIWQGEYNGKPTYSFTVNKSYKKGEKWENTNFFNLTDLPSLVQLINKVVSNGIKEKGQARKTPEPLPNPIEKDPFDQVNFEAQGDVPF